MKVTFAQPVRAGACATAAVFVVVALAGCRNDGAQRDAYIRELRMQEDQIYELQDCMTEYQELLRRQRCENAKLKNQTVVSPASTKKPGEAASAAGEDHEERSLLDRPTRSDKPKPQTSTDPDLPKIDLGEPGLPDIDLGDPVPGGELEELPAGDSSAWPQDNTRLVSATAEGAEDDAIRSAVFVPPPPPVELADSCALYAEQTPIEAQPGAKSTAIGLMAIVEPLTGDGGAGEFAGEVSLLLVDPIAAEEEWEIARWDYTAEEVESAWRDVSRRVLDLPVAAPASAPVGRPLELWVRLLPTAGDRKILCHTMIELVDPVRLVGVPVSGGASSTEPGFQATSGWTAADDLRRQVNRKSEVRPATWEPAAMTPPAAIARAEVQPATKVEPAEQLASPPRPREWTPFR